MDKQRKTFLSYSRVNKDFAVRLAKELKSEGLPVWLDQLDIPPGSRWDIEVEKALTECDIFMVIITKASSTSENVLDEISYAIDNGKRMLPVLLEKTNIPLRLRRFQYVDFTDKSFDEGVQSAKDLLRSLIAQPTVPRDQPGKTEEQISKSETSPSTRWDADLAEATADSSTDILRQEKLEQELLFKEEEARLMQENEELEKQLLEERSTKERMQAVAVAATKSRTKWFGFFGITIVVILIAGFLVTRYFISPPQVNTPEPTRIVPTLGPTEPLVPVSSPSDTPTQEEPTATEEVIATETPADTETPTETVPATPSSLIIDPKGVEMVLVPEGEFEMGSNRGETDEKPVHVVFLDSFYIDKYEVTNKRYQECVEDGICQAPYHTYFSETSPNRLYFGNPQFDNFPVVYVDWNMAKAYCEWRGARLPTEAEWEKAARGTEGNTYAWGRDIDCQKANYNNCVGQTSQVGDYTDGVSPFGAYDMTGNVWEWVSDWYGSNYYIISPGRNPKGPITGQSRVMRGGSWPRSDVTAYHRANFAATYNTWDIGIRCAGSLNP